MKDRSVHPTLWIQGHRSVSLLDKNIVLAVTGSIAAVRVIELARELIRHGANVTGVMSQAACHVIHPDALHYATGNEVITDITGKVEHVEFCGAQGCADLLVVVPATANTIGKMAHGIDDTPVTTFVTTALGSGIPLMVVPAMHGSMYDHPAVRENIDRLEQWGIEFIGPLREEGVAKIASNDQIVLEVERALLSIPSEGLSTNQNMLKGKKVVITTGSTAETIDPIRILTNRASGRTGRELALEAYRRGADVTVVHRGLIGIPGIKEVFAESAQQMLDVVLGLADEGCDLLISAAAISDYTIDPLKTKIKSGEDLKLVFRNTPKLIGEVRRNYPQMDIIGFKAETGSTREELIKSALLILESAKLDLIVANDVGESGMGTADNEICLLWEDCREPVFFKGSKKLIAAVILDKFEEILRVRDVLENV